MRRRSGIATAVQVDVPQVSHRAELVMVHRIDDDTQQITALNFSGEQLSGTVRSEHLPPGATVTDMFTGEELTAVDDLHSFVLVLGPYRGTSLLVRAE